MNLREYPVTLDELEDAVTVAVAPAHAPPVTLFIVARVTQRSRVCWVVSRSQDGHAVVSEHTKREVAVRSAIRRARRYAAAYRLPRDLHGVTP